VFVNLFGGRIGQPLCYPTVHRLAGRISARTGIAFTVHMLRHYVDGWVMWPAGAFPLAGVPRGPGPAT
jgi:integrase